MDACLDLEGVLGDAADGLRRFRLVLVDDLADDLLNDVLDGHQARRAAVFVQHDGHVNLVDLKLAEQFVERFGFRHEQGVAHQVLDGQMVGVLVAGAVEEVLGVKDADDAVEVASGGGDAAVAGVGDEASGGFDALVGVEADDVGARRHDLAGVGAPELEDVLDHVDLVFFDGALAFALVGNADDLLLDVALRGRILRHARQPPHQTVE